MVSMGIVEAGPRSLDDTCHFPGLLSVGGTFLTVYRILASIGMPILNTAATSAGLETALHTAIINTGQVHRRLVSSQA
jgi:hypothetical protein